jgi:hypothetical protein
MTRGWKVALAVVAGAIAAVPALGGPFTSGPLGGTAFGYTPPVPVSAFARPLAWFDPARLQVSTSVSVGSGWFGQGTSTLQLTQLTYQFASPLAMRVSVGNSFGGSLPGANAGFFLEGLDVAYRPHPSFQIHVQYQDLRSPLQLSRYGSPFIR